MSEQLTTDQIIDCIERDRVPPEWAWESAIDGVRGDSPQDAIDAARFLEALHPGRTWTADQYYGLMYNHLSGRWPSAAEVGFVRAGEDLEDGKITREQHARIVSTDAPGYVRSKAGTHVFDCADGSILVFDQIFDGVIVEWDPS